MATRITEIPAFINTTTPNKVVGVTKRKTAGYARVSTLAEEQASSYESQLNYYQNYIKGHEGWEFVGMYADEGISGTSTKQRKGFNKMIQDALDGRIDLIITKSVSRFARNTVDSLTTVRKLKEKGVEIFFEKENIWTLDSKGELLITIMSSLAQEESRSISENTAWGIRKQMAKGQVRIAYSTFLGYDKGANGEFVINEEQAKTVKLIYKLFLMGKTVNTIKKILEERGVKTVRGGTRWHGSTVKSILTNEKYIGDALLQKEYSVDFLTHKRKKNNGELKQYYITDHHEPIIDRDTFALVQSELKKNQDMRKCNSDNVFSNKIICGDCGGYYGRKVFHSNNSKLRKHAYRCNKKYNGDHKCETPTVDEVRLKGIFVEALNRLIDNKDEIISNLDIIKNTIDNREELLDRKQELMSRMSELVKETTGGVNKNAMKGKTKEEYEREYNKKCDEYAETKEEYDNILSAIEKKKTQLAQVRKFIDNFNSLEGIVDKFDEELFGMLVEEMVVEINGDVVVKFKGGAKIEIEKG